MPLVAEMEKIYAPKGIVFLGASLDEKQTRPGIPKFVAAHQITFPIWVGATGDDLARLGLGEAIPATAFLDEHGIIFARVLGQIRKAEILERLDWITGDRAGPAPEPLVKHQP
ncbi:MAG: Redoxin domain protein [Bryobacterales bacterium]|nr:Redoxin domain protein [Bryobacterales bacterium]